MKTLLLVTIVVFAVLSCEAGAWYTRIVNLRTNVVHIPNANGYSWFDFYFPPGYDGEIPDYGDGNGDLVDSLNENIGLADDLPLEHQTNIFVIFTGGKTQSAWQEGYYYHEQAKDVDYQATFEDGLLIGATILVGAAVFSMLRTINAGHEDM